MACPRDSRGRFTKKPALSSSGDRAALCTTKPPAPQSLDTFIMETSRLMEAWQAQYEAAARQHEASLAAVVGSYEKTIRDAQASIDRLVAQQTAQAAAPPPPPVPDPPQPQQSPPSAAWIKAPDGENLMVLNQAAAVMFLAVFGRMEEVTKELQRLVGGKKK